MRRVVWIVHVLYPSGEGQHLPLAQKLFAQVLLELSVSLASDLVISLCCTRRILQLFFAEL